MEKFPSFKDSLDKYTTRKIAARKETYVKYTPKTDNIKQEYKNVDELKEDFDIKEYTKDEYEQEKKNEGHSRRKRSIGNMETTPCSCLKLDLQVYYGNTPYTYMAYNYCFWKTIPSFRFEDAIGISLSNGLIASKDENTRHAVYEYAERTDPDGVQYKTSPVEVNSGGNGVMAKFKLHSQKYLNSGDFHNIMIQTGVTFNGSGTSEGWITGNYSHKQLAIGSIGMDVSGTPSVSINAVTDSHQGSISVSK